MNKKITDLKVEQVPCKKAGFREFKITYKYKGRNITDYKVFDDEIYHDKLDHELYRLAVQETNKRYAEGKLNSYARHYTKFTRNVVIATLAFVLVSAGIATPLIIKALELPDYLTFTVPLDSKEDVKTYLKCNGVNPDVKYTFNPRGAWIDFPKIDSEALTIKKGQTIYIKGNNPDGFSTSDDNGYATFSFAPVNSCNQGQASVNANGNIMSLIDDGKCTTTAIPNDNCFVYLFYDNNGQLGTDAGASGILKTAPKLPATTLTKGCYYYMFKDCVYLKESPYLGVPSSGLKVNCYRQMFENCYRLEKLSVGFDDDNQPTRAWPIVNDCTSWWLDGESAKSPNDYAGSLADHPTFYWKGLTKSQLLDITPTWSSVSRIPHLDDKWEVVKVN